MVTETKEAIVYDDMDNKIDTIPAGLHTIWLPFGKKEPQSAIFEGKKISDFENDEKLVEYIEQEISNLQKS